MSLSYQIDPAHSSANFSVKHMMIAKVHGGFQKINGKFVYDAADLSQSSVEVTIEAGSIDTHEPQRDTHLKSADFFDIGKYPTLNFKSTRFEKGGSGMLVTGDLTLHGVTRSVTLDLESPTPEVKDPWGNFRIAVSGGTKIKRKDFGLTWNQALETGGFLVGDDVTVTLDIQLVRPANT